MHSREKDDKARRWGLQLCFGLSVLYKMGHLKDVAREGRASQMKDSIKLFGSLCDYCCGIV
jgi:hypothetical protein